MSSWDAADAERGKAVSSKVNARSTAIHLFDLCFIFYISFFKNLSQLGTDFPQGKKRSTLGEGAPSAL